ncbi:MAG: YqaJ viral recombinase family protein [Xanthomonadaceae bacterium]|nr:YqaJ viral recombinase family protein [Xanthomonadaceae bacterium]
MPFLNLEQGSPEWLQARRGLITGSRFKDARDRSSGLDQKQTDYVTAVRSGKTPDEARALAGYRAPPRAEAVDLAIKNGIQLVWGAKAIAYARDIARERLGGTSPSKFQNTAMKTGTEQEPKARAMYEARTGYMVDEVSLYVTEDRRFGCSPDGMIEDDGTLEVKTMYSSDTLFQAVVDGDLSEYMDQCIGYHWLLARRWVDLALWIHDMERLIVIRIERDEGAVEALEADLVAFAALVDEQEKKLRAALAANDQQAKQAA